MKKISLELTEDEAELLLPSLKVLYDMDSGDPDKAPPGAAKNWKSMLKKLKAAVSLIRKSKVDKGRGH